MKETRIYEIHVLHVHVIVTKNMELHTDLRIDCDLWKFKHLDYIYYYTHVVTILNIYISLLKRITKLFIWSYKVVKKWQYERFLNIDMINIYLMLYLIHLFSNMYYQKVIVFMYENDIQSFWPYIIFIDETLRDVFLFDSCIIHISVISIYDIWYNLPNGLLKTISRGSAHLLLSILHWWWSIAFSRNEQLRFSYLRFMQCSSSICCLMNPPLFQMHLWDFFHNIGPCAFVFFVSHCSSICWMHDFPK